MISIMEKNSPYGEGSSPSRNLESRYVETALGILGNKFMGIALYATHGFMMPYTFNQPHRPSEFAALGLAHIAILAGSFHCSVTKVSALQKNLKNLSGEA